MAHSKEDAAFTCHWIKIITVAFTLNNIETTVYLIFICICNINFELKKKTEFLLSLLAYDVPELTYLYALFVFLMLNVTF